MVSVRIAGFVFSGVGFLLVMLGMREAESIVGRIETAVMGKLTQGVLELSIGGIALIIIGVIMILGNFRHSKA